MNREKQNEPVYNSGKLPTYSSPNPTFTIFIYTIMHPKHFAKPLFPISPGYYNRPKKNRRQWYVWMYGLRENGELTPAYLFGKILG